jgi:hypothetical protein
MTVRRLGSYNISKFWRTMTAMRLALILTLIVPAMTACHRDRTHSGTTSTAATVSDIPAAAAQPAPTGTDAMTQTVEVEDSRSEEDGGVSTATPAKTPPKPVAKTKSKKH